MSDKKIFTFGSGGVLVDSFWGGGYIVLSRIKPPMGYIGKVCASELENREIIYSKKIERNVLNSLKKDILDINGVKILEYEDFILDFTDYKEESVQVVLRAIEESLRGYCQLALGC